MWLIRTMAWPSLAQPQDQLLDPGGLLDAEGGGRLVHDDELGGETRRAADRDGLALAAGEAAHPGPDRGHVDRQGGHHLLGLASASLLRSRNAIGPILRTISRLRKRFCHTVRSSTSARFWCTVSMPASRASLGVAEAAPARRRRRWFPRRGVCTPLTQRISVDLPAPLSPTMAVTSPRRACMRHVPAGRGPDRTTGSRRSTVEQGVLRERRRPAAWYGGSGGGHFWNLVRKAASDDDDADRQRLVELGDAEQGQTVDQRGQQQCADDRADDGRPAAEQADAAEHHGGHRVEQEGGVGRRLGGADPGDQQDRRRSRPSSPEIDVDGGLDPRRCETPVALAASALPPVASTWVPNRVWNSTTCATTASTTAIRKL